MNGQISGDLVSSGFGEISIFLLFPSPVDLSSDIFKKYIFSSFSSILISDDYRTKNHPSYLSLRKIERYQSDIFQ